MSPRLAKSLKTLLDQVNHLAPNRSKATDGTIGNAEHQKRHSRHNPNRAGVICALDVTNDPAHGCDIHQIADVVVAHPHPNLNRVISNRRVASRNTAFAWHRYTGTNPHTGHAHFDVGVGRDPRPGDPTPEQPFDDTTPWKLTGPGRPSGNEPRILHEGSTGPDVRGLQLILIGAHLLPPGTASGTFGPKTKAAVHALQGQLGVHQDGVVGPDTHAAIARLLAFLAATAPAHH